MPCFKPVSVCLCLFILLLSNVSALAQTYSYPFADGHLELPALTAHRYKPVPFSYTVKNPTGQPAEVVLFQEMDEIMVYQTTGKQQTLLGKAGWLSSAHTLQSEQYQTFGPQHRTGFLFTIPARQTMQLRVVYQCKTQARMSPVRPVLYSRDAYRQFLNGRVADHLQRHRLGLIFTGCLLIMFLYTSMQYVILRERILLYYALYVLLIILRSLVSDNYLESMDGWPVLRSVGFVSRFSLSFLYWSLAVYVLFMREFVQLKDRSRPYNRVFLGLIGVFSIYGFVDIFVTVQKYIDPGWQLAHRLADVSVLLFGIFTLHTLWRFYDSVTKYLFWGVVFFMASGLASILNRVVWGDLGMAYDREVAIFVTGYILEILTFALGIAQRHELVRREKIRYQAQLRENEAKQARLNGLRDEIARDLHDEMGSQLSSISILSQTTTRYVTDERVRQRLTAIGQTARQVMESMREIVWSLNTTGDSLQNVGLRIRETALALFDDSHVTLRFDLPGTAEPLDLTGPQRRELFLIAKESLTNILRHARATTVWIDLHQEPGALRLSIRDNGRGFDPALEQSGLGLSSLQTRAGRLGATLTITSAPARGTRIELNCTECVGRDTTPVEQAELSLV